MQTASSWSLAWIHFRVCNNRSATAVGWWVTLLCNALPFRLNFHQCWEGISWAGMLILRSDEDFIDGPLTVLLTLIFKLRASIMCSPVSPQVIGPITIFKGYTMSALYIKFTKVDCTYTVCGASLWPLTGLREEYHLLRNYIASARRIMGLHGLVGTSAIGEGW